MADLSEKIVPACRVCSNERARVKYQISGYDVLECTKCDLQFHTGTVESEKLYSEEYFSGDVYADYIGERDKRIKDFAGHVRTINDHVPSRGDLLEIGCAAGFFLKNAQDDGWRVKGVEVSHFAADYGRNELGLDITRTDIDSLCLKPESYDAVVLWDVIEHLKDPFTVLKQVSSALRKNGCLFLTTGDIRGLNARIYGAKWYLYAPPHHIWYFSHQNMSRYVEQLGLVVERCTGDGNLLNNNEQNFFTRYWLLKHWRVREFLGKMHIGNSFFLVARKG